MSADRQLLTKTEITSGTVTVEATDLDIRSLTSDSDSVEVIQDTAEDLQATVTVANPIIGVDGDAGPTETLSVAGTAADGKIQELRVDDDGRLQVDIISGGGSNDSVKIDDSAFTVATDSITGVGAMFDDTGTDSVDEGDIGILRMSADRQLLTKTTIAGTISTNSLSVTHAANTKVAVGTDGTTEIVAYMYNRFSLFLVNDSDEEIYLSLEDTPAVMHQGIRLNANGGSFVEETFNGAIYAICSSGSKNITVCETTST